MIASAATAAVVLLIWLAVVLATSRAAQLGPMPTTALPPRRFSSRFEVFAGLRHHDECHFHHE